MSRIAPAPVFPLCIFPCLFLFLSRQQSSRPSTFLLSRCMRMSAHRISSVPFDLQIIQTVCIGLPPCPAPSAFVRKAAPSDPPAHLPQHSDSPGAAGHHTRARAECTALDAIRRPRAWASELRWPLRRPSSLLVRAARAAECARRPASCGSVVGCAGRAVLVAVRPLAAASPAQHPQRHGLIEVGSALRRSSAARPLGRPLMARRLTHGLAVAVGRRRRIAPASAPPRRVPAAFGATSGAGGGRAGV